MGIRIGLECANKSSVTPLHQAVAWDTHLDSAAIVAALLEAGAAHP